MREIEGPLLKVHEYQAKAVLKKFGVPVPNGEPAQTADEAQAIATKLGTPKVVVKSQIHAGGRGKGRFTGTTLGGVIVTNAAEAGAVAKAMLGNVLVTKQSGPEGRKVGRVLVEEGMQIVTEYYLALLLDRAVQAPVFIASAEGGTEIEEVAEAHPEAIHRLTVSPITGYQPWMGRRLAFALGVKPELVSPFAKLCGALYAAFLGEDASMVEINPLVQTGDGRILALDAKVSFDDNALYRHPEIRELRDLAEEDPLEVEASKFGLNYIKLDGNIACMVNGAGLAMGTMDIIQHHGGSPANFLDVGGGATQEMVTNAFRILLADPEVKAVLVNIFGGIMRCDVVAEGMVAAARNVGVKVPIVVRLEGTNVEKGREILKASGLAFLLADGMRDAAEKVVGAAGGR
jgi:succinyl-CoA synthetase beta subunit